MPLSHFHRVLSSRLRHAWKIELKPALICFDFLNVTPLVKLNMARPAVGVYKEGRFPIRAYFVLCFQAIAFSPQTHKSTIESIYMARVNVFFMQWL